MTLIKHGQSQDYAIGDTQALISDLLNIFSMHQYLCNFANRFMVAKEVVGLDHFLKSGRYGSAMPEALLLNSTQCIDIVSQSFTQYAGFGSYMRYWESLFKDKRSWELLGFFILGWAFLNVIGQVCQTLYRNSYTLFFVLIFE